MTYSLTNNDGKHAGWTGTSDQWFSFIKDAFDMLHREGAAQPKIMSVGLHMRMMGHPARAVGLERLLDYMMKQDGAWITRRDFSVTPVRRRGAQELLRAWQRRLYEAGFVGLMAQRVRRSRAHRHRGVDRPGGDGRTIIAYGTGAQKQRYLAPILSGDEI